MTYILDTSVLIANPTAYNDFQNSEVVIPITVLDELDKLKKSPNEAGKNSRVAVRKLDEISKNSADLSLGISLENDIFLKIDIKNYPITGDALYGDTRILACAKAQTDPVVVSNDLNMRVRARAMGMQAESYDKNVSTTDLYAGVRYIDNETALSDIVAKGSIKASEYNINLNPNECVVFQQEGKDVVKARKTAKDTLRLIKSHKPWDLEARNTEQEIAIDLLLDTRIPLITFIGNAGTGKSIIALACGLELVLSKKVYDRMIIYRPTVEADDGIGYLPGTMEEKLLPWMQPINDNLEVLMGNDDPKKARADLDMFKKKGKIEVDVLSYIRGRSIPNAFILFDEAQNCSASQIKTVLTRVGEGSRIVLTGDISQIDNKNLDPMNNGLSYAIEKFKSSPLSGHLTMTKGERSPLATAAAELL
jgi:PhoH-like ATPase